jgi:cyclase
VLKKRLIGVITVRGGQAVQSVAYRRHLPLGRPEVLAENLDRWGVDEILVQCIDRSVRQEGPDLGLLERMSRCGLATPLTYVGGIRGAADAVDAVRAGAERVGIDALLHDHPEAAFPIAEALGAQALVAVLPLSARDDGLAWLEHRSRRETPIGARVLDVLARGAASEALLVDWRNEGRVDAFDTRLVTRWTLPEVPLLAFGGLSGPQGLRDVLARPGVVGAAIGNFLAYREHAVQALRHALSDLPLRDAQYDTGQWS